jgi:hypothetical protein
MARRTLGWTLLACAGLLHRIDAAPTAKQVQKKQQEEAFDLSTCTALGVEVSPNCAAQWPRHEEPRIVLTALVKDTVPADLVRQIEYHLLLGVDAAIIFDNSCPDDSEEDTLEAALAPYAELGIVVFRKEYRCVEAIDIIPEKYPIGGSGIAVQLMVKIPELHPKNGTLVLALDDDEYIAMGDPQMTLLDLRHELIHSEDPSIAMKWHMYGSSGHTCQPSGSVARNFLHRSKMEDEMTDEDRQSSLDEAAEYHLNPPFGNHSQKYAVIWQGPDKVGMCDTHNCGRGLPPNPNSNNTAGPSPPSNFAYIAHYAYQSEQHWQAKKSRGRTTKGARGESREGPVPTRYSEVYDDSIRRALEERIDNITLPELRSCLKTVFGPTADPAIIAAEVNSLTSCAAPPEEAPRCGVTGTDQETRIAVAFYGAQRSTPLTLASIEKNLFAPLLEASDGAMDVFVHTMVVRNLDAVSRVKSEEGVKLCPDDFKLIRPCVSDTDDQEHADSANRLFEIAETAMYSNGTTEMPRVGMPAISHPEVRLNIVRSRFSMSRVARLVVEREEELGFRYTHVVMARADTGFASPLLWRPPKGGFWLRVPNFQHWKGVNDRFAYGTRDAMVTALLSEFNVMNTPGQFFSTGSEGKMCDYLRSFEGLRVGVTPLCLVRVRANGQVSGSDFHIRGPSKPLECGELGLSLIEDETDEDEPCRKVDGEELARWGWVKPPLHDVLQFIHIPKTGGTTVEKIGARYGNLWTKEKPEWAKDTHPDCALGCLDTWQSCSPWHLPLASFRARGESGGVNSLQETFCVVRDPAQRAISQFSFQLSADATPASFIVNNQPGLCTAESLNSHIHAVLGGANSSISRLEGEWPNLSADTMGSARTCVNCPAVADCHWLPQWLYVKDTCTHILRFENLESDFSALMKRFAPTVSAATMIPSYAWSRTDPSQVSDCSLTKDDLDLQSRTLLATVFAEDFRQFGYEVPDTGSNSALATMMREGRHGQGRRSEKQQRRGTRLHHTKGPAWSVEKALKP